MSNKYLHIKIKDIASLKKLVLKVLRYISIILLLSTLLVLALKKNRHPAYVGCHTHL